MKYESVSVKKAVQLIDENELLLPHIQRPFIWKQDRNNNQVKRFFDSLMRDYPIGTFLLWRTRDEIQARTFIRHFRDGMSVKDLFLNANEYKTKEKTLVLDGQQRLQTLYIALKGTYNGRELYFDILSGKAPFWDLNDELMYNFEYLTKNEAVNGTNGQLYWVLLKDIVLSNDTSVKLKKKILEDMRANDVSLSEEIEEQVEENVSKIKNFFTEQYLIWHYTIDSTVDTITDYDEILEIFIRANSGGTQLSKSDLMFSLIKLGWEQAEEEFENTLSLLNGQQEFYFTTDFVLKASLVLINKRAKFATERFRGTEGSQNLEMIRTNWPKIAESLYWTRDWLTNQAQIKFYKTLPSYNALIPIIYFAYQYGNKPSERVNNDMQTWLYKALLNENFSGQSDRAIDNCTDVIKEHSQKSYFPYKELDEMLRTKLNRIVDVNENIIDSNTHLILNLCYQYNNQVPNFHPILKGNSPEIDHIFPKSKMIRKYKYPSDLVNNIGNYMFLEKIFNGKKTDEMPKDFFRDALKIQPEFYQRNLIPSDERLHNPESFKEFVETRRQLIFETVKRVLVYRDTAAQVGPFASGPSGDALAESDQAKPTTRQPTLEPEFWPRD